MTLQEYQRVEGMRGRLYDGLYDEPVPPPPRAPVQLLNPWCDDEDPMTRRFAQLEIE